MIKSKLGVVAAGTLLALTSCSLGGDQKSDAPDIDCNAKPSPCLNLTHATVLRQPEGFRNISFGCWDTTGIYVTSRGIFEVGGQNSVPLPSSVSVVPNDPHCK